MIDRSTYELKPSTPKSILDSYSNTITACIKDRAHDTASGQSSMDSPTQSELFPESGMTSRASERQVNGDHYRDMPIQPSEFIHKNGLNWMEGNIIKYVCRHSRKHGLVDLDKAEHYLELLKEWEYGDERGQTS